VFVTQHAEARQELCHLLNQVHLVSTLMVILIPSPGVASVKNFQPGNCLLDLTTRKSRKCCNVLDDIDFSQSSHNPARKEDGTLKNDSDKLPCTHLSGPSKSQRGTTWDSLGCLCEVLLVFDIEPCCAIPPPAYIPSQGSITPQRSHASCQIKKDSNSVPPPEAIASTGVEKDDEITKI
jgi:hypothetical protein